MSLVEAALDDDGANYRLHEARIETEIFGVSGTASRTQRIGNGLSSKPFRVRLVPCSDVQRNFKFLSGEVRPLHLTGMAMQDNFNSQPPLLSE